MLFRSRCGLPGLGGLELLDTGFDARIDVVIEVTFNVEITKVGSFEQALVAYFNRDHAELMAKINVKGDFNDEIDSGIKAGIEKFKATQTW